MEANSNAIEEIASGVPFEFGIDSSGNYGYKKKGADTVIPFRKKPIQDITALFNQAVAHLDDSAYWTQISAEEGGAFTVNSTTIIKFGKSVGVSKITYKSWVLNILSAGSYYCKASSIAGNIDPCNDIVKETWKYNYSPD